MTSVKLRSNGVKTRVLCVVDENTAIYATKALIVGHGAELRTVQLYLHSELIAILECAPEDIKMARDDLNKSHSSRTGIWEITSLMEGWQ